MGADVRGPFEHCSALANSPFQPAPLLNLVARRRDARYISGLGCIGKGESNGFDP